MADIPVYESTAETTVTITANGQTVVNFDFLVLQAEQVKVVYRPLSGAPEQELEYPFDFTVSGVSLPNGGAVELITVATVVGDEFYMYRLTPIEREKDWQPEGDYKAALVNKEQDTIFMIMQELRRSTAGFDVKLSDLSLSLDEEIAERIASIEAEAKAREEADATIISLIGGADSSTIIFESMGAAMVGPIPPTKSGVLLLGYYAAGDGGGASYAKASGQPVHEGAFQSADGSWWEISEPVIDVRMLGARGDGTPFDGAFSAGALGVIEARGGGTVRFSNGFFNIGDIAALVVPDNATIELLSATVFQPRNGNSSAFIALAGNENFRIKGSGQIVGPAMARDPNPATDYENYPNQNAGVKLLGRSKKPVINPTIESGVHIWGWDVSGVFSECTAGFAFHAEISKCGVDGIRDLGSSGQLFDGFYIHDLYPGYGGNAPYLNQYGITTSRRPQRTNRFTVVDDIENAAWQKVGATVANGSQSDPYNLSNSLGKMSETAVTSAHQLRQILTTLATAIHYGAAFFEYDGTCPWVRLRVEDGATPANMFAAHFNIETGEKILEGAGGQGVLLDAGIEEIGPGRYRAWVRGRAATSGTGNARLVVAMLSSAATTITSGASYAGNVSRGVNVGGLQLVDNNFFTEFGNPLAVFPAPSGWRIVNGHVKNVPTWTGLDSHGGVDGIISNNLVEGCRWGIKVDEGDTSGTTNGPFSNISITGNVVLADGLADTATGIAAHSDPANKAYGLNVSGNTVIGYGVSGADLWEAAIKSSYVDDFVIGTNTIQGAKKYAVLVQGSGTRGFVDVQKVITMIEVSGVAVPLYCRSPAESPVGSVKLLPAQRRGAVTAEFFTSGNAWVHGGRYSTAGRPSPVVSGNDVAMIVDNDLNKPLWHIGSNWRDAAGIVS